MNTAHLHLVFNHAPIFATVFALALILIALLMRRDATAASPSLKLIGTSSQNARQLLLRVGLWTLVAGAVLSVPAFLTGEPAEEAIEHAAGVSESTIGAHESIAKFALIFSAVIGVGALAALLRMRKALLTQSVALSFFMLTAISTAVFAYTAYQGGQIRHPEITSTASLNAGTGDEHKGSITEPDSCCQAPAATTQTKDDDDD
jgi:hypothetical protein